MSTGQDRPNALYRMFNKLGELLYVGITVDIGQRFAQHETGQRWWAEVDSIAVEHHATRFAAEDAERTAIAIERPRFNVRHAPRPIDATVGPHTPHRNVRVPDERWDPFGFAVGKRHRSSWLNDFMDWVNRDVQLWRDAAAIATARGENLGDIVTAALRRYVARHRRLLDEAEPNTD